MSNENQLNKEVFTDAILEAFKKILPNIKLMSTDVSTGLASAGSKIRVELIGTAGEATQETKASDTPDYTGGDSSNNSTDVTLVRIWKTVHVTDPELQTGEATLGVTLPKRTGFAANSVGQKVWDLIASVVKTFTVGVSVDADKTLTDDDVRSVLSTLNAAQTPADGRYLCLKDAVSLIPKQTITAGYTYDATGVLTSAHGMAVIQAPGLPTVYVGTGANRVEVLGWAGHASHLAFAARPTKASQDAEFLLNEAIVIDGGIAAGNRVWYFANKSATFSTVEALVGVAKGNDGAVLIVRKAPTATVVPPPGG